MKRIFCRYLGVVGVWVFPLIVSANDSSWLLSLGVGGQQSQWNASSVNNGSLFPLPYSQDRFSSSSSSTKALISLFAGKSWQRDQPWLPAYSLGVLYQSLFSSPLQGSITQYSLPEFTNYRYQAQASSNLVLASGKWDLYRYHQALPYVTAGLGAAFNRFNGYQETALPGVTPRLSPGFADNSNSRFAYQLGAGVDYEVNPQLMLTVGYQYLNLGRLDSGPGTSSWSSQALGFGSYRSNAVLFGLSYSFDVSSNGVKS